MASVQRLTRAAMAAVTIALVPGGPDGQAQDLGTITTETLQPIEPDSTERDRFKPAPFKTDAPAVAPVLINPIETTERGGARLRQLDKMTGRIRTIDIAVGDEQSIDRLTVRLEACRSPEDNAQHGTMAFVEISDTKHGDQPSVFTGWMFAESPALSAMDHPRYDLWVISCTTSAGEAAEAKQ